MKLNEIIHNLKDKLPPEAIQVLWSQQAEIATLKQQIAEAIAMVMHAIEISNEVLQAVKLRVHDTERFKEAIDHHQVKYGEQMGEAEPVMDQYVHDKE